MKRSPIKRKTPLRSNSGLKTKTPIRPKNPKRAAKLRKKQFGGAYRDLIVSLGCCVCGRSPSEPAHVKSRGAGGTAKDMVPLCSEHHREQHQIGIRSFERKHGIDLAELARVYWSRWGNIQE